MRSRKEAYILMQELLSVETDPEQAKTFLLALNARLPTVDEFNGYLDFLREQTVACVLDAEDHFDLCGTGGDGKDTINISTLTAFVLAAMGEKVAKHGNYAASSKVGSSNLLEALRVPLAGSAEQAAGCFNACGIVFLHAPYWHPALKAIAPVRKALGVRTVFNMMGPLLNPAKPAYQIVGTPDMEIAKLLAEVMASRGDAKSFYTIADHNGYDEISLTANASLFQSADREMLVGPDSFKASGLSAEEIQGADNVGQVAENAVAILSGQGSRAQKSVIAANAALALKTKYADYGLDHLYEKAYEVLSSDKTFKVLEVLRK